MERNEVVKEVEERDFETLFELYRDVFNKDLDKKDYKKSFEKIKDRDIYILGYYINDEIVGSVTVYILDIPTGKEAMIWDFLVEERYRRQGIGTKLMKEAEKLVKEKMKKGKIWLFSRFSRFPAHELYRKLGYDENRDKAFVKIL